MAKKKTTTSKNKVAPKKAAKNSDTQKSKAAAEKAPEQAVKKPQTKRSTSTAKKPLAGKREAEAGMEEPEPKIIRKKLPVKERRYYQDLLHKIRDQVVDGISFLAGDNLNRSPKDASGDLSSYSLHMADQGTDNFDREFALNMVTSEQDMLYEIDEALQRLEDGSFGFCEKSGKPIEKERLKAIPYTRYCVEVQSEMERGRARYRPFGPTLSQQTG